MLEHDKELDFNYVRTIHHKPDSIQVVANEDQDLIIHFENNDGIILFFVIFKELLSKLFLKIDCKKALNFLKLHRDTQTVE